MEMQKVESSNIEAIGYDIDNQTLNIDFKGTGIYNYSNFPKELFDEFASSTSKGSFFHRKIRSQYHANKVQEST